MKFYKNINELVESLTKDIITDKYEIEEFDDSYINQLEAIYNSSYFKPCKKAIIDQFISLLNDEDNIKHGHTSIINYYKLICFNNYYLGW